MQHNFHYFSFTGRLVLSNAEPQYRKNSLVRLSWEKWQDKKKMAQVKDMHRSLRGALLARRKTTAATVLVPELRRHWWIFWACFALVLLFWFPNLHPSRFFLIGFARRIWTVVSARIFLVNRVHFGGAKHVSREPCLLWGICQLERWGRGASLLHRRRVK